jgi:adenosine deaminase
MRVHLHWEPFGKTVSAEIQRVVDGIIAETYKSKNEENKEETAEDSPVHLYAVDSDGIDPDELQKILTDEGRLSGLETRSGYFLLFSESLSLDSWDQPDLVTPSDAGSAAAGGKENRLKQNAFVLRILRRYRLGRWVPIPNRGHHEDPYAHLRARLRKLPGNLKPLAHFETLRQDVKAIQKLALKEIGASDGSVFGQMRARISSVPGFLTVLRAVHQLGRRPHREAEAEVKTATGWEIAGPVEFRRATEKLVSALSPVPKPEQLQEIVDVQMRMRCYEILRDLGEWLAFGAARWLEDARNENNGPLKVLIVDEAFAVPENFGPDEARLTTEVREHLTDRLHNIMEAFQEAAPAESFTGSGGLGTPSPITFDHLVGPNVWKKFEALLKGDAATVQIHRLSREEPAPWDGDPHPIEYLLSYAIVLVEVEFRNYYAGPRIVRLLSETLDRLVPPRADSGMAGPKRPSIMVLSQSANFTHVQQCLNLGADAWVRKERIYELPMRAVQARITRSRTEPRGQKSNFRILYALPAETIAEMSSFSRLGLITGHDEEQRAWLRDLPKTDLHTHIGTCIDLRTVEALAANTVGHLLHRRSKKAQLPEDVRLLVDRVVATVSLAGVLEKAAKNAKAEVPPWQPLSWAVDLVLPPEPKEKGRDDKDRKEKNENVYARIIRRLQTATRHVNRYEVTALLVAALAAASREKYGHEALGAWNYIAQLAAWAEKLGSRDDVPWLDEAFSRIAFLLESISNDLFDIERGHEKRVFPDRVLRDRAGRVEGRVRLALHELRESGTRVKKNPGATLEGYGTNGELPPRGGLEEWPDWFLKKKVEAEAELSTTAGYSGPKLQDLVTIAEKPKAEEQTLLDYLRGTELLGADHLQYPENLLLAARSVSGQMSRENVWYCELRCETVGYTEAGMGAINATDLLCLALDVATAHQAVIGNEPCWTRFNVLLGAKRHKPKEKFQKLVALVEYYLQQPAGAPADDALNAPEWWMPCRVVGFDLSGDEGVDLPETGELIRPLFLHSAPITIHAGEAASAESIWRAVYDLRARRIGHGLRLRENTRLLNYCVDEGICMELCPISNQYTNAFYAPTSRADYDSDWREYYPLRYYLERGLDVCINTDNRQLHRKGMLTDDYERAAQLTGGLTRWEVLKIVKAGFKHAFLLKREVQILLHAVESRVYDLLEKT